MPQFTITVNRPEVSVSTTQTGPSVTINETPVSITQNTSNIAVTSAPHSVTVNTAATTIQTTTLDEAFQGEWGGSVTYHRGDLVRYEQSVYVYIDTTPRTTNAPDVDTDYWVLLFSETGLTGEQVIGLNRAINLTTWDPATEYSIGDIVVLRGDYEDSMDPVSNTTYPKFTLYRLCHISGSINVNPSTHCTVPSLDESNNLIFDANSAWQNLSGVRSIDGFSGDISLQALLDHGSVSLNALSFEQGSNENHGSFVVHADDSYFYGNALYIGGSTSDQLVGFLLTNSGGSGYVAMDPADGKIKFTNDLTNVYPLPTSTDDLAEGTTNKYYNNTLVADYLANNIITASEIRAVTGGYMVITDQAENNYFYVDDNATQVGAGSHTWQFNNDGSTSFPTFSLPATDGSASQVLTTNGLGVVTFATPSTSNITEGTNLFYTTTRFDDRLATKTTDNVSEGTTNKYFTNTRFDDRLATKSTTNLAEGTNLYYTTTRQNTDFDARLATKSTTNLAEGTNLYYTSTRANSDFDTRLATKSTTNLTEGTNLYHTDSRVRSALSGSTGITYNNTTGSIAVDTSTIATQSYVGTAIANLVDSSPSTLDTLNELAAALGDDPNFATTVSTNLGNKLNTSDFTTTANTWYSTSDPIQNNTTDDLAEGTTNKYYTETRATNNFGTNLSLSDTNDLAEGSTNKYYTDGRARASISASGSLSYDANTGVVSYTTPSTTGITEGTNLYYTDARARDAISLNNAGITAGLTYNSTTGVLSYVAPGTDDVPEGSTNLYFTNTRARSAVDNGVDLDVDGSNNVYVKSIRDTTRVKGAFEATRNDSYVFPASASQQVSGNNGFDTASSGPDVAGPKGYGASNSITQYFGDTAAGVNSSASMTFRGAQGTNSAPSAIQSNNVMGTFNWSGYSGTDFATNVATASGGGGRQALHPLQMQGYTTQAFTEGTTTVTTTTGSQTSLTIGSVASTGSGVFTNTSADVRQYDVVRITGTLTGTMSFPGYTSGNLYYVLAGGAATTTFTLSTTQDGDAVATTAGTTTGLTFIRHRSILNFAAQTYSPFGLGSNITVAGTTPTGFNGNFRTVFGTTTSVGYGNYHTGGAQTVAGTVSTGNNVTAGGVGFRIRGFANSAIYNTANRINYLDINGVSGSMRTDSMSFLSTAAGTTYANFTPSSTTFTVSGNNNFIRQSTTNTTLPAVTIRHSRTDTTGSNDGDGVDFRMGTGGTSTTNNIARFDTQFRTSGLHDIGIATSIDSFITNASGIYRGNAEQTVIRAIPAGTVNTGGTPSDVAIFTQALTTIKSNALTLQTVAGASLKGGAINYRRTFGCFHKMADITAAAADTVYNFDWTTSASAHVNTQGITVSNTSRLNIDTAGHYCAILEMNTQNTDNADRTAYVWLAKNGTDLADTCIRVALTKDTSTMITKEWLLDSIAANDYVEVRFAMDNTSGISLQYEAAQTTPYARPAIASATITIRPVGA